jgi:hypothetical protein
MLEQQSLFVSIGMSEEASKVRTSLQLNGLVSDMSAFKVQREATYTPSVSTHSTAHVSALHCVWLSACCRLLTPNASWRTLCGGIRRATGFLYVQRHAVSDVRCCSYHNPREPLRVGLLWVQQGDGVSYGLSTRMQDVNNVWHKAWAASTATPADHQRPLFDSTAEAEKASVVVCRGGVLLLTTARVSLPSPVSIPFNICLSTEALTRVRVGVCDRFLQIWRA